MNSGGLLGGRLLNGEIKRPEFEVETISERPSLPLVKSLNAKLEEIGPTIREMAEEAPEHLVYSSACNDLMFEYKTSAPSGVSVSSSVCCGSGGKGAHVSGTAVYYCPRVVGATAWPVDVLKEEAAVTTKQGTLVGPGRMGGTFGWSEDRKLVAGILASYTHNFVELLALYRERAKLPLTEPWVLPNMTLAETKAPEQFVLPATFTYTMLRPSLRTHFDMIFSSETPIEIGLEWWNMGKGDVARIDSVEIPAGDNRFRAYLIGAPMRGIFNINPINAPHGCTIKSVSTRPICVGV